MDRSEPRQATPPGLKADAIDLVYYTHAAPPELDPAPNTRGQARRAMRLRQRTESRSRRRLHHASVF